MVCLHPFARALANFVGPERESLRLLKKEIVTVELLLDSIPSGTIEGLILNTLGSKVSSGEVPNNRLPIDGCASVYAAISLDKSTGLAFSINKLTCIISGAKE